jgi:NitT/TauT family transport system substrate-binding protein
MRIINVYVLLVCLGIALVISSCVEKPTKYTGPVEKITVAAAEYLTGTPVYIAEAQGFFKQNGLDVTIKGYKSGKAAGDALITGEADISTSAGNVFVRNSFEHADIRVFGTIAAAQRKELIARKDKGFTAINDLIGKKLGVTKKSGAEFQLGVFLAFNYLSYKDMEIVDLRPPEIVKAILNGDIDAAFTWDPYAYNIEEELGDNAISWPGGEDFYFVLIAKDDWIKNNPSAVERFIKSILEAEDYIKENSEIAKEFAKKRFDYEPDYIDYSWPKQKFVVVLEQAMLILFEDQARWAIENKLTDKTEVPNYLDFIYMDALEKARPDSVTIIH